ncbi:MAG: 50S ribosomal protein L9 [Desulfobacterales bacterium]|nr:50S ribosomal protein L9 [Desulfobacterales bacterium]
MKVILLTDVIKLGNRHEIKELKDGYANMLISRGLAELATPQTIARLSAIQEKVSKQKEQENKIFSELITKVNNKVITLKEKTNEKGHLFFAVPKKDISQAIKNITGLEIDENHIIIPKPIKEIGSHQIKIKKGDKEGECTIIVDKV